MAGGEFHPSEEQTDDGAFNRELSDLVCGNIPNDLDCLRQNLAGTRSNSCSCNHLRMILLAKLHIYSTVFTFSDDRIYPPRLPCAFRHRTLCSSRCATTNSVSYTPSASIRWTETSILGCANLGAL